LIFDRRFETPFIVAASYLDLFVAILNDDAINFGSIELDDVLCLALRFFGARLSNLKEFEVSKDGNRDCS